MTIKLEQAPGQATVTILSVQGDLDASNYQTLINAAKHAIEGGALYLLIDMSMTTFMSSSGLIALHSIALLMRGDEPSDPEHGWEALRALDRDLGHGIQEKVKLLNPDSKISRSLEISGLLDFFEVHNKLETAVASFK